MNLKELAKLFLQQCKDKDFFGAMKTAAEILSKSAATGELLFGTAEAEDLEAEHAALTELRGDLMKACSCGDGSCVAQAADAGAKAVDPALVLALVDVILKLIAARRNKQ
jgi:hypothetical protein